MCHIDETLQDFTNDDKSTKLVIIDDLFTRLVNIDDLFTVPPIDSDDMPTRFFIIAS